MRMNRKLAIIALALGILLSGHNAYAGDIGIKDVEGRLNFVSISETDAGSTFGLAVTSFLGPLTETLGLEGNVDFWTKTFDVGLMELSWTNIGFGCNLRYDFSGEGSTKFYGFGGLSLNYVKWSSDYNGPDTYYGFADLSESSTEFGINLGAAAEFGSGDGMIPVARAGYCSNGGADYLFIGGGLKFPMGGE